MLAYPFETAKDRTRLNDPLRQITLGWFCIGIATKLEGLP
jgi:hypothetical protein